MFSWYQRWRLKVLMRHYLGVGEKVGRMLSYSYMGEALGFKELLEALVKYERRYVDSGYRPVTINQWVRLGGWGEEDPILGILRDSGELPTYPVAEFAATYQSPGMHPQLRAMINGEIKGPIHIDLTVSADK